MASESRSNAPSASTLVLGVVCALLGAGGALAWNAFGPGGGNKAKVEAIVRNYLLAHPEVLPEAMAELERKQTAGQLAGVRTQVEDASARTVLGNPQGKVTLVEFSDYACTYCRHSVADVDGLIAANPDLRVIVRELPILSPGSADAARMAIAAAEQGRYAEFHKAMFEAGRPDPAGIETAARAAGLDMARARTIAASPAAEQELVRNLTLAKQLGFSGTPSWVAGEEMLSGALGKDRLAEAIAKARSR